MVSKNRARVASVAVLGAVAVGCHRSDQPQSSAKQAGDVLAGLRDRLPAGVATGFDAVPRGFRPRFATSDAKTEARVVLPAKSTDPLHVEDARSGLGVDVVLRGARDVAGQAGAGYVAYPRGHVSGATVVHRPLPIGAEDFLSFAERPRVPAVEYDMTVGPGVKGLRLVANTLEMIDGAGMPRLRVSPPYIVGADGAQTDATLAVDGCAVDLNPAGPWGRAPTPPGAATCTVRVSWNDQAVVYPAVLDPRWTTTTSTLNAARQDHTATVLSNGKVLVAGGRNSGTSTAGISNNNAELYDPATGIWTPTDNIASGTGGGGRWFHTATQLPTSSNSATSGMVLIAGGLIAGATTAGAKLYSVTTGHWTTATSMSGTGRDGHTATLLSNGKVLLTGGENVASSTTVLSTAEIYDPSSGSGGWASVATNMAFARKFHTATLLTSSNSNFNNRVLIVGGTTGTASTTSTTSVQVYNISAGTWSTTTALPAARDSHTATALPGGNVLITGGRTNGTPLATALVYTIPSTGTLTSATWPSAGTMSSARWRHTATLLSGTGTSVLVSGGASNSGGTTLPGTPELWNGVTTWTLTATAMAIPVQLHTATLLSNGAVLVAGGSNASGNAVASSQLYDPSFGQSCTSNSQCVTGFCMSGVCCATACTDQCSACNLAGSVGTCAPKATGTACNDNNMCTTGETCTSGTCGGGTAVVCSGADTCHTVAACVPATGCPSPQAKNDGTSCDDQSACTTGETCTGGTCGGGTAVVCPGADTCHTVACVPATGCGTPQAKNNGTSCDDQNACTTGETCTGGTCGGGTAVVCPGADTCNTVACVPATGCAPPQVKNDGTPCNDGNACTQNDTCRNGVCNSGAPLACPGDACRPAGTCDVTTGLCSVAAAVADNTPCNDGNRCSINDVCKAGTCMPGPTTSPCQGGVQYVPVVNLGSTQEASYASGINNLGEVIGVDSRTFEARGSGPIPTRGFRWTAANGMQPLPQPANTAVYPHGINATGAVAGQLWDFQAGGNRAFRQNAATDTQLQLPAQAAWATAINDSGVMTGVGADATGFKMFRAGTNGVVELLSIVAGDQNTQPQAIDSTGSLFGFTIRTGGPTAAIRYTDLNHIQFLNQLVPTVSDWAVDPVVGGDYLSVANATNGTQIIGAGVTGDGLSRGFIMIPSTTGQPGSGQIKQIGMVSTLTSPASFATSPRSINHNGEVVGAITDLSGLHEQAAFIWVDGTGPVDLNQLIDPASGWTLTAANGINDSRQVVGSGWINGTPRGSGQERAFTMQVPNLAPCQPTVCRGPGVLDLHTGQCSVGPPINEGGTCDDSNACSTGDHCSAGACVGSTVTCPGDACRPAGVCDPSSGLCSVPDPYPGTTDHPGGPSCDDGNRCTTGDWCNGGICIPGAIDSSCMAQGADYFVPVTDLGSTQGASYAVDINNAHEVIGGDARARSARAGAAGPLATAGVRWTASGGMVQLPQPADKFVFPHAINVGGVIAGTTWDNIPNGGGRVFSFNHASDTQLQFLAVPTGNGTAINDGGLVAGSGYFVDGMGIARMFRGVGSNVQDFPGLPNGRASQANAIDPLGNLLGYTVRADFTKAAVRYSDAHGLEYLNQFVPAGSDWDLDPASPGDFLSAANGTNGTQIVGSGLTSSGFSRGFVMTLGADGTPGSGIIKQIPMMSKFPNDGNLAVSPRDVNQFGEVVGAVTDSSGIADLYAFIWVDGTGAVDLNDLIDPASGWILAGAYAINDSHEVVGYGWLNGTPDGNGQQRAFKMTVPDLSPCPAVACHAQPLRDLRTGQCPSTPAVADGASCDDGNACTSNDTCQEGACSGGPLDVSCALDPRVEGVTTVNGEQLGVFSYNNAVFQNVNIPYGGQNYLTPPGSDPNSAPVSAPPAWFLPGLHRGAFTSPLTNGTLSWTLGTKTVIADEGTSAHLTAMTGASSSGTVIILSDGTNVPFDGVAIDLGATIVDTVPNTGVGGTLPGTFDVTDDGEATYRIPLWVPEGKAGLQPQLALTYNSRQGNSVVGLGWRIDGLSTISRCHMITGRDGVTKPIQFTDDDRLCLDGERLVLVGGTYNQAGAEYRTEHDQFIKILQTGQDALGPTGFLVYLPNGLMRSYGNDTTTALTGFHGNATAWLQGNRATMTYNSTDFSDPTVAYSTPARLSWALASVADRYTNRIDYNYAPLNPIAPDFKLDFRISSITYNMPDSGGAGGREIDFEYDQNVFTTTLSRSDVRDSFVSGLPLRLGHVLGQITIHGPDPIDAGVLRRYVMSYQNGNPLLLQSVQECDSAQHCKPSTTFDYTPASFEFERKPTGVGVSPTQGLIPADMDGDGKDDLVYRGLDGRNGRDSVWRYLPSLGTGLGSPITVADVSSDPPALNNPLFNYQQYGARVADMNMDGRADLFVPRVDSSGHSHSQVLIAGASGFTPFNTGTDFEAGNLPPWGGSKPVPLYSADFNGDGLPDLMRATSPTIFGVPAEWSHRLSSASSPGAIAGGYTSFFQLIAGSPVNPVFSDMPVDQDWNAYAFDFDGDGKSELLVRQAGGDASGVLAGTRMTILRLPDGSTSSVVPTSLLVSMPGPDNSSYMMLDVNGDGLPDAVEMPNVGGDVRVAINTGSDFLPPAIVRLTAGPVGQNFDGSSPVDPATRAMDFDQDGRADLFLMNAGGCNPLIPPRSHPVVLRSSVQNGAPTFTSQTLSALPIGWPAFQNSCAGFPNSRVLDVNGDGLSDFVQVEPFAGTNSAPTEVVLYIRSGQKANLLRTATDGLGHRVDVQYKPITDPTVHTRVQCSYPQYCTPHGNTWVVAHHSYDPPADDPTGPPARSYTHTYTGFRSDLTGFGGLGMDQHNQVDDRTTQSVLTTYDHSRDAGSSAGALNPYALLGRIKTRTVTTFIPQTLHANIKNWDYTYNVQSSNGGARLSVTPKSVTFTEVENSPGDPHVPGSVISQTIRNSQVGTTYNPDFGYLTDRTTTINGETKTEGFTFDTDRTDTWLIGQTHRSTIKYDTPVRPATQTPPAAEIPAETVTRTTEYHHDPNTGALSDVIVEPDSTNNDIYLATTYVRNQFGQVETTREHKLDGKERTTKATYDPISGVYPYRHTNALGQPLYTVYHPGLGVLVAAVDPNGLTVVRKYDRLGRIREQDSPNGSMAIQTYDLQSGTNGPDGMIVGTTIDGSSSTDFYDRNGRPTVHSSTNDNGDPVSSRTFYDPYGRVTQRVLPYDVVLNPNPDFGSMPSIVFTYDELGRQTSLTAGPSSTAWSYDGKTATHIVTSDSGTQSDTSTFDEIGRLVTRVERVGQTATTAAHDVTTRYVYAPFGSIRDVVDTAGNITHADYDVRGRRRALHEPDSGDTIEHHDAFGNLTSRTDGSNRTVSFVPDPLGRVTVETTTEGDSFFAWDTSANGIGSIGRTTSWDGAVIDVSYYNNGQPGAGQVEGEHWEVDGIGFQVDRTYDSFGRPSVLEYPESDVTTHSRYAVQFDYNPNSGALQDVRDLTRGSAALYQVTTRFPDGQVHEDVTGDEVTTTRDYEPVRRLLTSITSTGSTGDIIQQLGYHYDRRGLMDSRTDLVGDSSGSVTEQFTHDELGRLTRWQGDAGWAVGYTYDDIGNLTQRQATSSSTSDTVIFTPGGGGGGPHALGSLTAGGTTESFSYDPAGRQWQAGNRTVTYTDFDLPRTITSPGVNASFEYDANHRRVVKRAGGATTIYVGGLYELRVVLGMATHVMYVPGEQGNVAQVTQAQGGQPQIDFFHGDHLGSIYSDVGPSGMTAMRFDPFGSRISPGSLRSSPTPTDRPLAEITRGFAGLEHDDELGLINMNGRIYDPATARYLTPDPMVSEPGQSQSFNKYSYAQNSPLMRWDPSGWEDGDVEGGPDTEVGGPDNSGIESVDNGSAVPTLPGGPVPDGCVGACGQQGPTTVEVISPGADDQGPGGTAPPDWGTASHEGSGGGAVGPEGTLPFGAPGGNTGAPPGQRRNTAGQSGLPLPPGANPAFQYQACGPLCGVAEYIAERAEPYVGPIINKGQGVAVAAGAGIGAGLGWLAAKMQAWLSTRGSEARGQTMPEHGPFTADDKGNIVPTPPGGAATSSPDGKWIQARDANGNPTGIRKDGPHNPTSHPDPRAQQPHGHVPDVTNSDGTPWLPIY